MSENRLSIPELEDRIAALEGELQSRLRREPTRSVYTCTRCQSIYTSPWGCGCIAGGKGVLAKEPT